MPGFDFGKLFRTVPPEERLAALHIRPDLARAASRMVADERSDAEVHALQALLSASERVVCLVEGRQVRRMGLLALTTERVVFRPHRSAPASLVQSRLTDIDAVLDEVRGMTSSVRITGSGPSIEVDKILGTQGTEFAQAVRSQLDPPAGAPIRDPLQELTDLRARHAAGSISEEDYRREKARLVEEL